MLRIFVVVHFSNEHNPEVDRSESNVNSSDRVTQYCVVVYPSVAPVALYHSVVPHTAAEPVSHTAAAPEGIG